MLILRLHSHSDLSWTSERRADTVQPQALKFNETIGQIKTIFFSFYIVHKSHAFNKCASKQSRKPVTGFYICHDSFLKADSSSNTATRST